MSQQYSYAQKAFGGLAHFFDFAGDDGGQLGSELLRLLEGGGEAAEVGQALHADQPRGLAVCRLSGEQKTHQHRGCGGAGGARNTITSSLRKLTLVTGLCYSSEAAVFVCRVVLLWNID